MSKPLLGIVGGLGPLASAYFYELITQHTKAQKDQDHIDIILSSRASTPDRTAYITGKSPDCPLPYMIEDAVRLEQYGADALVIPCNTAHYFIDEVRNSVKIPVPSIIEETSAYLKKAGYKNVQGRMFPGLRHEILLEKNREEIFEIIRKEAFEPNL